MALDVRYTRAAQEERWEAYVWYETQRTGLGDRFLTDLDRAIDLISEAPELGSAFVDDHRRWMLPRPWPYFIVYRIVDGVLLIDAVFHGRRAPRF